MNGKKWNCGLGKLILPLAVSFASSCFMVSVSLAQEASTSQSGAVEIWLRLYQFSAAEFDLRALEETVDQLPHSLSLEDWLTIGKAMPALESSLRKFLDSHRAEIMNRKSFHLDRKCIMFDRAIFALGWLHSSEDTGNFLAGIQKDKMVGLRFFQGSIIQSLGMVADSDSVNCLDDIIRSKSEPQRAKETAVYALTGGFLSDLHIKCAVDENTLQRKRQVLKDGLARFLMDESLRKGFDVEAIVERQPKFEIDVLDAKKRK